MSTLIFWPSAKAVTTKGENSVPVAKMEKIEVSVEALAEASAAAKRALEADSEVTVEDTEVIVEETEVIIADPQRALQGVEAKTYSQLKISLLCSSEQTY